MSTDVSRLVHTLRQASAVASHPLRPGPAEQLIAAALGYATLAAYQAGVKQEAEPRFLDDAEHVIIDVGLLQERAGNLAMEIPALMLVELIAGAFDALLPRTLVHKSLGGFEEFLLDRLHDEAGNGHVTSGPMAMTNSDGIREIYLPFDLDLDAGQIGDSEQIEIDGHVTMEPDIERPYSGHHIDVKATIDFTRFGRQLLQGVRMEIVEAKLSYDW
jgi:hypothetical protein